MSFSRTLETREYSVISGADTLGTREYSVILAPGMFGTREDSVVSAPRTLVGLVRTRSAQLLVLLGLSSSKRQALASQ